MLAQEGLSSQPDSKVGLKGGTDGSGESSGIVHLSRSDWRGGGARSAYRLHRGLRSLGQMSTFFVAEKSSADSDVIALEPSRKVRQRLKRRLIRAFLAAHLALAHKKAGRIPREVFSLLTSPLTADLLEQLPDGEAYILHWVAGFVDPGPFLHHRAGSLAPIVWRPSDLNPFTGGCHYDFGCGRYAHECGMCPYLGSQRMRDLSYRQLRKKMSVYCPENTRAFHVVAQSQWMASQVRRSRVWRDQPVTVIPNGVDLEVFHPREKRFAREALALDPALPVIAFVADDVSNIRKGSAVLIRALLSVAKVLEAQLVCVGQGKLPGIPTQQVCRLGPVRSDQLLALIYSAADVFVAPSLEDNAPNTILEAMACGTAVVASRCGGIPEIVEDGSTGSLVAAGHPEGLARTLTELCRSPEVTTRMGRTGRQRAIRDFSILQCAQHYLRLLKDLKGLEAP